MKTVVRSAVRSDVRKAWYSQDDLNALRREAVCSVSLVWLCVLVCGLLCAWAWGENVGYHRGWKDFEVVEWQKNYEGRWIIKSEPIP